MALVLVFRQSFEHPSKPGRPDIIDRKEKWEMFEKRNVRKENGTNSLSFNCNSCTNNYDR